jgi:ferredoxin
LSAHVIPVETWSADAVGLDLLLGSVALGATRVAVLGAGSHDLAPLQRQAALGQAILGGLGYGGEFLRIVDVDRGDWPADLAAWVPPAGPPAAEFHLLADKRTTLEFVIDHLAKQAPAAPAAVDLPAGAPFGMVAVSDACTLCMSCVGACPAGALKAAADAPRLSFLERNCVQCGLCANTCPEGAVTLTPRLLVQDRRQERILREAEIFRCTACGKPMGAAPTIERMLAQLSGHSMFATPAAKARLTMCGDCRVVDLIQNEGSLKASEMTE